MNGKEIDDSEMAKWDPAFTKALIGTVTPLIKRWFRAEVRGLESFPPTGGVLLVSNHSGGVLTPDWNVLAPAFYGRFGYGRPLYTLAHYGVFFTPFRAALGRLGVIHASRDNAVKALRSGAVVLAFPGGDYDAFRPTLAQNVIDFGGRTGYVRTAMQAGVPIVPAVSIGGQETQLFVTRGNWLAKHLGFKRIRIEILPVTIGLPFGLTVFFPANMPLPAKIIYQVLEPIDVAAQFGEDAEAAEVDASVRSVMQAALDELGHRRRVPLLG
ncbi:lysophospholipid acyltransferase family protein [Mycobacterium kansasii]|uniref:Diacylglycerol acyltransferase family protein n=2 Tax=Mycobacterium kansasii TaxID=1768 RepID=A0A1V3X244_MYCKA|nr:lysophospholipid acyltransferase family protein [Mycobacterium kansasii]EUA04888.1 diacylglycerol acyltransferase family protein [Mycobacterium kansasii 824]AGZ51198.1 glycerol acyltransferase [Mycobacterium kansasii ATCC 12478]KEP39073.1 glycerol acyltransferase [Mycobacterium kansasii]MXO40091.1 acyltransferase family protein [Mycobacterium kansasii]OOK72916.1 diacylglycerol acyltransferase family protein [Mycobacterium kansasii]